MPRQGLKSLQLLKNVVESTTNPLHPLQNQQKNVVDVVECSGFCSGFLNINI